MPSHRLAQIIALLSYHDDYALYDAKGINTFRWEPLKRTFRTRGRRVHWESVMERTNVKDMG